MFIISRSLEKKYLSKSKSGLLYIYACIIKTGAFKQMGTLFFYVKRKCMSLPSTDIQLHKNDHKHILHTDIKSNCVLSEGLMRIWKS